MFIIVFWSVMGLFAVGSVVALSPSRKETAKTDALS